MTRPPQIAPQFRSAAEAQLARAPPAGHTAQSAAELLHELHVHQIQLEMQNEALRQAQVALEEARDLYVDLYEFAPVGYLTVSRRGLIEKINLTGAKLLGVDRRALRQKNFARFVVPQDQDGWYHFHRDGFNNARAKRTGEMRLLRNDGTIFDASLECLLTTTGDASEALRITLTDVTERRRAQEELRIAAIAFESQEGMIVTDAKGVILRVNRAFNRLTGYTAAEAIGKNAALLKSGRHDPAFYQFMWQTLAEGRHWQGEMWNRRKNGKIYAEWVTISAVTAPDGTTPHFIGTFSDITRNREAEAEIHRLAYYDPLTQLPNRRLLQDRVRQAMVASSLSGQRGALLFLDLDNFKNLNDSRGHDVGDALLIEAAGRIRATVRAGDTVARHGGDEFVLVIEDLSPDVEEAEAQTCAVMTNIRAAIARPYILGGNLLHCSASVGAALFHGQEESVEALFKHADLAMYQAKAAGRDTLRLFHPSMQIALDQRSAMEADLRVAVAQGQFHLYFQPQLDEREKIIGAEALLRWEHPALGLVPPGVFIPVAEETGLILPLGRWVMQTACAQIRAWAANPATQGLRLAVNVSPRQFRRPEFVAEIRQVLHETGADPTRIDIEITEGLLIDSVTEAISRMQDLKADGIGFSIDDFGTGFSSLSYLKRLPLDRLKIDSSFVRDLATDPNDAAIVQTIITMGRTLGLGVIAEGVETQAQQQMLRAYGCTAYQGYLFSPPLPLPQFEAFVAASPARKSLSAIQP
jgi:diguanylate cyclase (GGDEF)-like protein/PAS domain S-box-containing protein